MWDQLLIVITGPPSIWWINDKRSGMRKLAAILGTISQPAWLWAAYAAGQWGIFFVDIIFTIAWIKVAYFAFRKENNK